MSISQNDMRELLKRLFYLCYFCVIFLWFIYTYYLWLLHQYWYTRIAMVSVILYSDVMWSFDIAGNSSGWSANEYQKTPNIHTTGSWRGGSTDNRWSPYKILRKGTAKRLYVMKYNQAQIVSSFLLTHIAMDEVAAISQTIVSNAFSWKKIFLFWLKCHRN